MKNRLITLCAVTMTLAATLSQAQAFVPRATSQCDTIAFESPPKVVMHTSEMEGFDIASGFQMVLAMLHIHARFEQLGGTSARVTGIEYSSEPYQFGTRYGDDEPTIHVGWTSDEDDQVGAATWSVNNQCKIKEAFIRFRNPSIYDWVFGEPSDEGEDFHTAGLSTPEGRYFRISYVHELLHAFGLSHSNSSYAMLNYGARPFANRDPGGQVMPLPDDIRGLRYLYPAHCDRTEIAVLTTWYEENTTSTADYPAANQRLLCRPSTGSGWGDRFDSYCGDDNGVSGSRQVCPGETLRVRFAVANYGTEDVDVDMNLYFSEDEFLDGSDVASHTVRSATVGDGSSTLQGRTFTVPLGVVSGDTYTVIVEVDGVDNVNHVSTSDWSPLRGTIKIKDWSDCLVTAPELGNSAGVEFPSVMLR